MKTPFGRRQRPPAPPELVAVTKEHGKALAWGTTTEGALVVAAPDALVISSADSTLVIPWHAVDVGAWQPPKFSIRYRDLDTGNALRLNLSLAEAGELPPVLRERVDRTVLVTRRVTLVGESGVVMAARRDPTGQISWTVVFDPGLDPRDPQLQAAAREGLAELRRSLGA